MSGSAAFTDFERETHDRLSDGYHAAFTPVTAQAHPFLLKEGGVGPGRRVLDVATGPGVLAGKAAALGAVASGIDLSPRMIELAGRLHPGLGFQVANAETLPFAAASFEAILCNFGIGHFARPEAALTEFVRVLVPGGRLAVSWWEGPARSRINGMFFEALQAEDIPVSAVVPPGPSAFRFSDEDALRALLQSAGFEDVSIFTHESTHPLPDFDALWALAQDSFARLGAVIAALPAHDRRRLRAAVEAKAAAYGKGPLNVPIAFKVASARRPA